MTRRLMTWICFRKKYISYQFVQLLIILLLEKRGKIKKIYIYEMHYLGTFVMHCFWRLFH